MSLLKKIIKYLIDTDYGCNTEELRPCPYKFPVLNVVADNTFGITAHEPVHHIYVVAALLQQKSGTVALF